MPRTKKTENKTIFNLKEEFELNHSEELFGIVKPIDYQCPRIDQFINDIENLYVHFNRFNDLLENYNLNKKTVEREINIILQYEDTIKDSYEELRQSIITLRSWGDGWKDIAKKLFEDIDNNINYIDDKFRKPED